MPNTIKHKRSSTVGLVPGTGSIDQAELAINIADGKIYTKNSSNAIINLGVTSISGTYITPSSGNFANNLTVSSLYLSSNIVASNSGNLILKPSSNAALQADNSGNSRGVSSVDLQMVRSTGTEIASGNYSVIGGGRYNVATGSDSVVNGGWANTAAGSKSTVGGGYNNSANTTAATICGGESNIADATATTVCGGISNSANDGYATVGGGYSNLASSLCTTVCGGNGNTASEPYSFVGGGTSNSAGATNTVIAGGSSNSASGPYSNIPGGLEAVAHQQGEETRSSGKFVNNGDAQIRRLLLRGKTTLSNSTALLTFDGSLDTTPSNNSIISYHAYNPNNSAKRYTWLYNIRVVARNRSSAAPESAAYRFEGILESSSLAGVILLGNTKTVIHEDATEFDCNIYEYNTTSTVRNDGLYIEVSRAYNQDEDIYWLAYVEILELGINEYENAAYY